MSTIYYLYTYLYCDMLPGQPFAQNTLAHTYAGRENIFPLQSPRLCARTLTSALNFYKNAHLSLSVAPPLQQSQARVGDTTDKILYLPTLQTLCPSLFLSFYLLFSYFLLTTFCLQCQVKVTSESFRRWQMLTSLHLSGL